MKKANAHLTHANRKNVTIFMMTLKVDNQTWYEHVQLDRHYRHIVAKDLAYKTICENVKIKVFAETGNHL